MNFLIYLREFKRIHSDWNPAKQSEFYDYLKEKEFITGNAGDKAKDARQKLQDYTT